MQRCQTREREINQPLTHSLTILLETGHHRANQGSRVKQREIETEVKRTKNTCIGIS